MSFAGLDLNLLVAFEALMTTRSVSQAAYRLGVRQPAMSAALARLRRHFGDELFVRAAGAMQPTPLALSLAPGIAAALALLSETLNRDAPFRPDDSARDFCLASTDYTSLVLAPAIMARVRHAAPGARLRILGYDKDDIAVLLDRGEVDMALGTFAAPSPRAVVRRLCSEHFVGLARRDHGALSDGKITLADYVAADHALVTVRRDRAGAVDVALAARGLKRRVALCLPHMTSLPAILAATDLLAAVPSRLAAQLATPVLATFALPIPVPHWHIQMVWNEAARGDPAHGWLRALVAEAATIV